MERSKLLKNIENPEGEIVVYVMSRDQRVKDNFALSEALKFAKENKLPLVVLFNLYPKVSTRALQHYEFMIEGLKEVQQDLKDLKTDFVLTVGNAIENYLKIEKDLKVKAFFFDFSPLKGPHKVKKEFVEKTNSIVYGVDTHNIVPVWITSDKEEFAAYTIRPKILRHIKEYLKEPETLKSQKYSTDLKNLKNSKDIYTNPNQSDWEEILKKVKAPKLENYKIDFKSGEKAALHLLQNFLEKKLEDYAEKRNDPSLDQQSGISPYLHFGQISSLRIALETLKFVEEHLEREVDIVNLIRFKGHRNKLEESARAFLEEVTIRKELSDNFCFYNKKYDSLDGLKPWALDTLSNHKKDTREFNFTLKELEFAKTYDEAWNSAQQELIRYGKIHGYMRMYWAKKILEWNNSPKEAVEYAVYLNDHYSLDGYDPNGYVGILWSIGGLHDRQWFERDIFGKIRYMNFNGLKRKFNIESYKQKVIEKIKQSEK